MHKAYTYTHVLVHKIHETNAHRPHAYDIHLFISRNTHSHTNTRSIFTRKTRTYRLRRLDLSKQFFISCNIIQTIETCTWDGSSHVSMGMHKHTHIWMITHMRTHMVTCRWSRTCGHTWSRADDHAHADTHGHVQMITHMRTHMVTCRYSPTCTHNLHAWITYIHIYILTYIHARTSTAYPHV